MKFKDKLVAALLFFLTITFSYGQDGNLVHSNELPKTKSDPYRTFDARVEEFFVCDDGSLVSLKIEGLRFKEVVFQKFSGDRLNEEFRKSVKVEQKECSFEFIREINNEYYLFYSSYHKKSKTEQLYVRLIDVENGDFSGPTKLIAKTEGKLKDLGKFSIVFSNNKSFFAIRYMYASVHRDNTRNIEREGLFIFDNAFNELLRSDFTMPYKEGFMENLNFTVGSDGIGYFLIKKYQWERGLGKKEDSHNQSLAILKTNQNGSFEEISFDLEGGYVAEGGFISEIANKTIICTGYFRKPNSIETLGLFIAKPHEDSELVEVELHKFHYRLAGPDDGNQGQTKGNRRAEDQEERTGVENLKVRELTRLPDGSLILSGEVQYTISYYKSVLTTNGQRRQLVRTHHIDDIVLVKINAEGEQEWSRKIKKKSSFESFRLITSEKYTDVLFRKVYSPARDCGGMQLLTYRFNNETGEQRIIPLFCLEEIDGIRVYQSSLKKVVRMAENTFALELYIKKKKDRMFKTTFDE
ncbi:MAG: hypothetical protein QNK23_01775 [Crocinitomicaceae bacterium]|nr:hypothetical protein [Crocinitomicaceae bacterium]